MTDKVKIKIQDLTFGPDPSSSKYHESSRISWDRSYGDGPLVFFTDSCFNLAHQRLYNNSKRVAWIIEPKVILPDIYLYMKVNWPRFDLVLSHDTDFVEKIPNAKYYPNLMSHVSREDWGKYPKDYSKISIIASEKNWTEGHNIRHKIIAKFKDDIFVSGRGYEPIEHKIEVLKDSAFHLVIENCKIHNYFSEKLLDSISTYCVPLFWGSDGISEFFNPKGIITLNSINDLDTIIPNILENGEKIYNDMLPYLEENFNLAIKYGPVMEDWIFDNILIKDDWI